MRAPLVSFILVLAVVTTVHLVPAACKKGEEAATVAEEHGGSIKPMSLDGYGPLEKAAKEPKEPKEQDMVVQGTPSMTTETYNQNPIQEQAGAATASNAGEQPDKYVESLLPKKKVKKEAAEEVKEKPDALADESAYPKKEKKVKKEKKEKSDESDDSDESTSSKKEKKEKSDDSDVSSSSKKKKKAKTDDSDEDASLVKKKKEKEKSVDDLDKYESGKKEKKHKSDDSDSTPSPKREKKEKSIDSDASAYDTKEEKKSGDSDEAASLKKQKKEKKKKKKEKSGEENPDEDAAAVDVSADGQYVSPKEKKSGEDDATPGDVATTTFKPKGGERQISTPADAYVPPKQDAAAGSPDELPPSVKSSATADAYASPKQQQVASSMAGNSPDELPPSAKSSATSSSQPMAGSSPDELPPAAKSASATADPYASMKAVLPGGRPIQPGAGKPPKLSMETFSGMIKNPIAKILSPVITGVCAKTQYPADCEASIGGLPGAASAAATDSIGVLKLAMEAVRQKAIEAMNAATARMNAPGMDDTTKEALFSCTGSYGDLKASIDNVDDALKRGDIDTAKTNLDSVETDVVTCDDGFQERGVTSVMTDHDQELQKLASNLVAIGDVIKHQ